MRTRRLLGILFVLAALAASCGDDDGSSGDGAAASDAIPFTSAVVETAEDGTFDVRWKAPDDAGTVAVYAGEDPDAVGRERKVGEGPSAGAVEVADLPDAARWYFELVPEEGESLVVADRSLHLASAPNLRDAGGYRTEDGRWVRMGLLYRSDGLDKLSDEDYQTLLALDMKLVCDLRTKYERDKGPDRLPPGTESVVLDVLADSADQTELITKAITSGDVAQQQALLGDGKAARLLVDGGRALVTTPSAQEAYTTMLDRLSDPASYPTLFHCTAGKDRTGWASALVLSALGVDRETVEADYLRSNDELAERNEATLTAVEKIIDPSLLEPVLGVRREYLAASFEAVADEYGDMDAYLEEALELDDAERAALEKLLLAG